MKHVVACSKLALPLGTLYALVPKLQQPSHRSGHRGVKGREVNHTESLCLFDSHSYRTFIAVAIKLHQSHGCPTQASGWVSH